MNVNNLPLAKDRNTPLALEEHDFVPRSYSTSDQIINISIDEYKAYGKGLTYESLLENGIAKTKRQGQDILKYCRRKGTLFTLSDKRPQEYYPSCLRSEILKKELQKNALIDPIGVGLLSTTPSGTRSKHPLSQCIEHMAYYTLEGYILPLLPEAPLLVHNLTFKTKIIPECYSELNLPYYLRNKGKHYEVIIGLTKVDYVLYSSGTVIIHTTCSNYPYKVETEEDRLKLVAFFGRIRAGLISLLNDRHERIVPGISEWEVTECDLNKDIKISDFFHMTALKIKIKHIDHLLGLYVKAMEKDTVLRVEETKRPNMRVADFITDIFNPMDSVRKDIQDLGSKMNEICGMIGKLSQAQSSVEDTKKA